MNHAFGTSSIQEQSLKLSDKLYHHIINPFTGKCDLFYDTVVVVGSDPSFMDLYSTVFFMMDKENIAETITELNRAVEEVYLCKDHQVIFEYKFDSSSEVKNGN